MAELIAFLLENFQDLESCPPSYALGNLLEQAGFDEVEIGNTLLLLELLTEQNAALSEQSRQAMRVYCPEELDALSQEIVDLLYFLERAKALNASQREIVVHTLLHLPPEEITLDMAKIMVLLVLWTQQVELPVLIGHDLMAALYKEARMH
ncbi:MAG: DUF494 family protein [Neisseria sp.]|nr:DUF494 family protein [Neisseria sp.]